MFDVQAVLSSSWRVLRVQDWEQLESASYLNSVYVIWGN